MSGNYISLRRHYPDQVNGFDLSIQTIWSLSTPNVDAKVYGNIWFVQ